MRSIIALLMMLWLPLQGFTAVAMPFCEHAMHGSAATESGADAHAGHGHHTGNPPTTDAHHIGGGALFACNDCGVCHLACTPAAPSSTPGVDSDCTYAYSQRAPARPPLFIPEQPKHPPLSVRA